MFVRRLRQKFTFGRACSNVVKNESAQLDTSGTVPVTPPTRVLQHFRGRGDRVDVNIVDRDTGRIICEPQTSLPWGHRIKNVAVVFLPNGYPQSIGKGYLSYVLLQSSAMILSTAGGVLSMKSLLVAIGLGAGAIPLAATLNWIIKDGIGQFGGVLFASLVDNQFDENPKRWRMVSAISMDVASFIELCTPLVPMYFLPLAAVANVGKNIAYLSASASRAAIHKSFAVCENLADVTAKTGSQSILSSLLGTGLGIGLANILGDVVTDETLHSSGMDFQLMDIMTLPATSMMQHTAQTTVMFLSLSILGLMANYWSLQHVTLSTLTRPKLTYVMYDYILQRQRTSKIKSSEQSANVLSPYELRAHLSHHQYKSWLHEIPLMDHLPDCIVGATLTTAFPHATDMQAAFDFYESDPYIISIQDTGAKPIVYLLFKSYADKTDLLYGYFNVFLVLQLLYERSCGSTMGSTGSMMEMYLKELSLSISTSNILNIQDTHKVARDLLFQTVNEEGQCMAEDFIHRLKCRGTSTAEEMPIARDNNSMPNTSARSVVDFGFYGGKEQNKWIIEELLLETKYARVETKYDK